MARDYYPLIARAIAGLSDKSAKARLAVYDRARTVLVEKMREFDPGLSSALRELDALDEAIGRAESEAAAEIGSPASATDSEPSPPAAPCHDPLWDRLCRMTGTSDHRQ